MAIPTEKHLQTFEGDIFQSKELAEQLLDNILLNMELPNCFGLYGNWGSGKSTIIHYMLEHIRTKSKNEYKSIIPVYFEPWKYEYTQEKDLLFALLSCIKNTIEKTTSEVLDTTWKRLLTDILVISSGVLRGITNIDVQTTIQDFKIFEDLIYKEHERWVDTTEEFKKHFQEIIQKVLQTNQAKKMIIFIDDLDRCLPDNTVKLIESIKNFLSVDTTLFVLAIDRRVVSEMIEKKYGLHGGYGDEYLTKIIPYHYSLPKKNMGRLLKEIIGLYPAITEYKNSQIKYIHDFLLSFCHEPRIAKHYLHQFCMSVTLSPDAKSLIYDDQTKEGIQLQYLFVASYLLTKYPNLFSKRNNEEILIHLGNCAQKEKEPSYNSIIQKNSSINIQDRKDIEKILRKTINLQPNDTIMNIERLNIAMNALSFLQYE